MIPNPAGASTYCPRLWTDSYINQKGDVFACCHEKPRVLGNIYQQRLADIVNSEALKKFRRLSLAGKLSCFKRCTVLGVKEKTESPPANASLTVDRQDLRRLHLQFGEACNIRCVMCFQDRKSRESLNFEKFISNLDMTSYETVTLQGGEPLLIEDAVKFFDHAAQCGKKVSFFTNGLLIDDLWAEKIALHSEAVTVSLNAATKRTHEKINRGSRWEVVLKNIERLRKAREKYGQPLDIIGRMTLIRENLEEIPAFIENFSALGFDRVSFGYVSYLPYYLSLFFLKRERLRRKILEARTKIKGVYGDWTRVDANRLERLGLLSRKSS